MTFQRLLWSGLLSIALLCGVVPAAQTAETYTYQGNNYWFFLGPYDATMSLQIEIQFANPLAPNLSFANVEPDLVGFGYFDGVQGIDLSPYDPADFSSFFMRLATDANGDIVGWSIDITVAATLARFRSFSFSHDRLINASGLVLAQSDVPGAWTLVPDLIPVEIDIKPGDDLNPINLKSKGVIPVAILGSDTFDVLAVDAATLAFGPNAAAPAHGKGGHPEDVNDDGLVDLVSHYRNQETGILAGALDACVTGETLDGTPFRGCETITTVGGCGLGFELVLLLPPLMWIRPRAGRHSVTSSRN